MKMIFVVLAGVLSFGFAQARELTFSMSNSTAYLVPSDAASCNSILNAEASGSAVQTDISGKYISATAPKLMFASHKAEVLTVKSIVFTLESPNIVGGTYTCEISGAELLAQFSATADNRWNGKMSPNSVATSSPSCPTLKCGGIKTVDASQFTAWGKFTVNAEVRTGFMGSKKTVTATHPLVVMNVY